jgi:hypothetical protein
MRGEIDRVVAQANDLQRKVFSVPKGRPITPGLVETLDTQGVTIQTLCAQIEEAEQDARRPAGGPSALARERPGETAGSFGSDSYNP